MKPVKGPVSDGRPSAAASFNPIPLTPDLVGDDLGEVFRAPWLWRNAGHAELKHAGLEIRATTRSRSRLQCSRLRFDQAIERDREVAHADAGRMPDRIRHRAGGAGDSDFAKRSWSRKSTRT